MSLVLSELESEIKPLFDISFRYKKVNPGFQFSRKINPNFEQRILISHGGYPDMYRVYPPTVAVTFSSIEKTLNTIITTNNFSKVVNNSPTFSQVCVGVEHVDFDKFKILMTKIQDFDDIKKELIKLLDYCAMPFLMQYDSIEKVADLLAKLSPVEIAKYIQGSILFPKTLLILKMCNHNKFHQKVEEFNKYFESQSESNIHSEVSNICKMIILNEKK